MSAPVDVLASAPFGELPEPRGYAWSLNGGGTEYTEDPYCPVEPEAWSYASALYDADQVRAWSREAVSELVAAARQVALLGTDRTDAAARRLDAALAKFGGGA